VRTSPPDFHRRRFTGDWATLLKAGELHLHCDAVVGLEQKLRSHLEAKESISTSESKDLVGGTRKFVIPLAELFDARKVTLRGGDKRVLRKR
jgi:selenocysteine-specific elongation factor